MCIILGPDWNENVTKSQTKLKSFLKENNSGVSCLFSSYSCVSCLQVKVLGPDNSPLANTLVYLSGPGRQNLTTDLKGMASFSFDTTSWSGNTLITVRARIGNIHTYQKV